MQIMTRNGCSATRNPSTHDPSLDYPDGDPRPAEDDGPCPVPDCEQRSTCDPIRHCTLRAAWQANPNMARPDDDMVALIEDRRSRSRRPITAEKLRQMDRYLEGVRAEWKRNAAPAVTPRRCVAAGRVAGGELVEVEFELRVAGVPIVRVIPGELAAGGGMLGEGRR